MPAPVGLLALPIETAPLFKQMALSLPALGNETDGVSVVDAFSVQPEALVTVSV